MKRVLCFQNASWGEKALSGGDIRFIEIFKRLRSFYEVSVFTNPAGKRAHEYLGVANLFTFYCTPEWFDRMGIYVSYFLRTVYAWLVLATFAKNYEILYATSDFFPDVLPCFLLKTKKQQWVQVVHHIYVPPARRQGDFLKNVIGYFMQRFSFALMKKRADKVIVVNELVKQALIALGFPAERIFVNSNGLTLEAYARKEAFKKDFDLCMIGRFHPSKGHRDLLSIYPLMKHKPQLALVGGGEKTYIESFLRAVEQEGLSDVIHYLGQVSENEKIELLFSSKIFVLPSHEEGWGIVIAEAMAAGLPVVVWDLPNYTPVFGDKIIKVPENDYRAFAQVIDDLLADEEKRKHLGEEAREFVKRYDWSEVAKRERVFIEG
ncbi:glycosyltransferase family 4 protein [Thermospira aquatica]|uniref:Glycosyltransferase family 4 protein n=1 Tax=Thermospira aquatica TaxID=2828656 RepID=A0AAX3BBT6_9SPIR|nr:glycosyltransferase family 4 protein [Thermospira aquatica]URA09698.1 glycosyltransferase family 4 protein [Thermospira aquatica]